MLNRSHGKIYSQKNTDEQQNATDDLSKKLPPGHAYRDYKHPSEAEHRTTEQFAWESQKAVSFWTLIAAVVAVALSFGSLYYTGRQAYVAQATLVQADRPWVKIEGLSDMSIKVEGNRVTVDGYVNLRNVGHSPAQHTFTTTLILVGDLLDDERRLAKEACKFAADIGQPLIETLIFPDEAEQMYVVDSVSFNPKKFVRPSQGNVSVVGCVAYEIGAQQAFGETAFIFGLGKPCEPLTLCPFDLTKNVVIHQKDMYVRKAIGGTFAE